MFGDPVVATAIRIGCSTTAASSPSVATASACAKSAGPGSPWGRLAVVPDARWNVRSRAKTKFARTPDIGGALQTVCYVGGVSPFRRTGGGWVYALRRRNSRGERKIEQTFTFDWSAERVRYWPTERFSFPEGAQVTLDGRLDTEYRAAAYCRLYPDWRINIFDTSSGDIPFIVDWEQWEQGQDKFGRGNPAFRMRDRLVSSCGTQPPRRILNT